jgi:hypothetical protein
LWQGIVRGPRSQARIPRHASIRGGCARVIGHTLGKYRYRETGPRAGGDSGAAAEVLCIRS